MAKKNLNSVNEGSENKKESFLDKMKNDKQYSARIQLTGYGIFIVGLVIVLNIANMGSNSGLADNRVLGNVISSDKNTAKESTKLLENLSDNYSYNAIITVNKKSMNTETNEEVITSDSFNYSGKAFNNKLEINKKVGDINTLYYKVDNNYYSMIDNITSFVKDTQVYDIIDSEYIELEGIMELLDKASLDHVTNYSSGKRESVYHLKVKDVIVSAQTEDIVEINTIEENDILMITIDYSNLFKIIDLSIDSCKVEVSVNNIGNVEDFEVIVNNNDSDKSSDSEDVEDENTSVE